MAGRAGRAVAQACLFNLFSFLQDKTKDKLKSQAGLDTAQGTERIIKTESQ